MVDQASIESSIAEANALQRPVILGERTLSEEIPSIAAVMHEESNSDEATSEAPESKPAASNETVDTQQADEPPTNNDNNNSANPTPTKPSLK